MRIGIISDIHGNLEALRAVLDACSVERVDQIVCLGDCLGYGSNPSECLDLVFESCSTVIAGNHDLAAAGLLSYDRFNSLGRISGEYCRARLTDGQLQKLRELKVEDCIEGAILVHATPERSKEFPYLVDIESAELAFAARSFRIAFFGHTHVPVSFRSHKSTVTASLNPVSNLTTDSALLCNVGSVGQPRDRDPRACFAVFDSTQKTVTRKRVEYDVQTACRKILAVGLPDILGKRLLVGT